MKTALTAAIAVALICGTSFGGLADRQPSEAAQKQIDAISAASKSNDWKAAQQAYGAIDLRVAENPVAVLQSASAAVGIKPGAAELRREIATKYWLLRKDGDPDLADTITPTVIPIVEVDTMEIDALVIDALEIDALEIDALEIEVVVTTDEVFLAKMNLWTQRFGKQIDYHDTKGRLIVPAHGSVLWRERKNLMSEIEAGGDYDALWEAYSARLRTAVERRQKLRRQR